MRRLLVVALVLISSSAFCADIDLNTLAQRFRPILRFSKDGPIERCLPCSWQWFYTRSEFWETDAHGNQTLTKAAGDNGGGDWNWLWGRSDVEKWYGDNTPGRGAFFKVPESARGGQPWKDVYAGTGIYCHAHKMNEEFYNIEYWILFAYNDASEGAMDAWAANQLAAMYHLTDSIASPRHDGDLICMQMVYDSVADKLVRLTYLMHGIAIMAFDLTIDTSVEKATLPYNVRPELAADPVFGPYLRGVRPEYVKVTADRYFKNGPYVPVIPQPAFDVPNYFYFARLPGEGSSHEHPVVFLEWGMHEPWPNSEGTFIGACKHGGDDQTVVLQKVKLIDFNDMPFVYFGGHLGDPTSPTRHNAWLVDRDALLAGLSQHWRNDLSPYVLVGGSYYPFRGACYW